MDSNTNPTHPIKLVFLQHTKVPRKGEVTPVLILSGSHFCCFVHLCTVFHSPEEALHSPRSPLQSLHFPKCYQVKTVCSRSSHHSSLEKTTKVNESPFLKRPLADLGFKSSLWFFLEFLSHLIQSCGQDSPLSCRKFLFISSAEQFKIFPLSHPVWSSQMALFPGEMAHWDSVSPKRSSTTNS